MHDSVSNHQPYDCLLNRLFRRRSKKTSKLRVTGLCAGNSPVTGEFPAQMASNAENVSIWWRHDGTVALTFNYHSKVDRQRHVIGISSSASVGSLILKAYVRNNDLLSIGWVGVGTFGKYTINTVPCDLGCWTGKRQNCILGLKYKYIETLKKHKSDISAKVCYEVT